MRDRYRLRFVGRFVFACRGTGSKSAGVTILAQNMTYNEDLSIGRHRLWLVASRLNVQMLGVRPADLSAFGLTPEPDASAQIFAWDLQGFDVTLAGAGPQRVALANWDAIADVGALAGRRFNR